MDTVTHEVSFSFDQPEHVRHALSVLLQQKLSQLSSQRTKPSQEMIFRNALTVLIIDSDQMRAQYIADILRTTHYQAMALNTTLDAFTHFLKGSCIPFAVILGQDDKTQRLFLQRLFNQMAQKFEWEPIVIRLDTVRTTPLLQRGENVSVLPDSGSLLSNRTTAPLPLASAEPPEGPQLPFPNAAPASGPLSRSSLEASQRPRKARVSLAEQSIGRYQIGALLGSSLYSDVYETYDRLREQQCALKAVQTDTLPSDFPGGAAEETYNFQQEVDLLSGLRHPHILPLFNCGKSYVSGSPFIYKTMPYCAEQSLAFWIPRNGGGGSFSVKDVARIVLQLADVLQYLHERHILYQNFKMSNILILNQAQTMEQLQIALTDLPAQDGPFKARTPDAFLYVSPERWHGSVFPASDQYGLAAIAYELWTGRPPFQGSAERILRQLHTTMQAQPPSVFNARLPRSIDALLLRALAKKPEDRFPSIAHFAQELYQYVM